MSGPSRTAMLTVYPVSSDRTCRYPAATRVISIELIAANPRSTTRGPSEYRFVSGSCCTYPSLASVATYRCVVLLLRPTARARSAIPSTGLFSVNDDRIVRPRSSDCENAADGATSPSRVDSTPWPGAACVPESGERLRGMRHDSGPCFNCSNVMLTSGTQGQYRSPHSDCSARNSGGIHDESPAQRAFDRPDP